jgi:quinol monooxygenase YgiN
MNISFTATLNSKPEFTDEVEAFLRHLVTESRKESTCIQYDLHRGVTDKTLFIFHEIWESEEALEVHNQQPYIQAFRELTAEKLQTDPIVYLHRKI